MKAIYVTNINDAFDHMLHLANRTEFWRVKNSRNGPTIELKRPLATVYERPMERVLFHTVRDANPFFHFFEALWILAGNDDVAFLAQFNKQIAEYSDNGKTFHAPYGHRLRKHFDDIPDTPYAKPLDQVTRAIQILKADTDSRRVVLAIWDPTVDLDKMSKDLPCNDFIFLKINDGALEMRVGCRSNDAIWGAYGANVVQFSTLQEYIACAVGVEVGEYTQISDSFHIYTERADWPKLLAAKKEDDPYGDIANGVEGVRPYSLWTGLPKEFPHTAWDNELQLFMGRAYPDKQFPATFKFEVPYLNDVAKPMLRAWRCYKSEFGSKNHRIENAIAILKKDCAAEDWSLACRNWLNRRMEKDATT